MKKQLAAVSLLTALVHAIAFIKLWLVARLFGVGAELDGYNLALVLPSFISGVLSGAFQTGLFPVHARLSAERGGDAVARFERSVLLGVAGVGCAMAALALVAAPWIAAWLAREAPPGVRDATGFVLPFAAALIAFNAVGDAFGYLLALRHRYPVAAAAPIANAILGAGLLAAWPEGGLLNLSAGTVLGLALQVAICLVALRKTGFRLLGPLSSRADAGKEWREMLRLGAWILPGVVFSNLTASLPPVLVAQYGEGAVSAFGYAYRLHTTAVQLLIMAGSPILLARFSELVARQDHATIWRLLGKSAKASLALGVGAAVFVWMAGAPLLEFVFGGRFDGVAARRVADHWVWLTAGLAFATLGIVFAKIWQAQRRPRMITAFAAFAMLAFVGAVLLLLAFLKEQSIAAGLSLSSLAVVVAGWFLAIRRDFFVPHPVTARRAGRKV